VQTGVENGAILTTYLLKFRCSLLQNVPFRSQIFKIFFASGGKGALTPLTKILRTSGGLVKLYSDAGRDGDYVCV